MNSPQQPTRDQSDTPAMITTWHLEMTSSDQLKPCQRKVRETEVRQVREPCLELNRFFYETVGRAWHWADRRVWSEDTWLRYVTQKNLTTWIGYASDTPFGYFELDSQAQGNVELAMFGVLPTFIGRGLGGFLLSRAIEQAWSLGAKRVWVHTCSLDHPSALGNYQARGFSLYDEVKEPPSDPVARSMAGTL